MHPLVAQTYVDTLRQDRLAEAERARRMGSVPRRPGRFRRRTAAVLASAARRLDPSAGRVAAPPAEGRPVSAVPVR